ncbi:tyrosine-protein phosphatase [Sphingomonas sp.]|jgi:protein tyrosine/serine phosphatase|uniref:tyrosine-protein phosphatase n=1 Tax=Sphingomonas sp. TaxID=28214 RepID=UPI0035C858D4
MDTEFERVRSLQGIHNFRDYGGYRAVDGVLRTATLFRSGQHAGATPADLGAVQALHLRTVVDLRGDAERRAAPCVRHPEFGAEVLFAAGETAGDSLAPHEEAGQGIRSADEAQAAMTQLYTTMPFRPVLVDSLRLYFAALATQDGSSLVHCLAGKDRTGWAVALLHHLLGVHADDIMADYLLTNTAGDQAARIGSAAASIRERYGAQMDDDAIVTLMSVHPDYLMTAFDAIQARYGSVTGYAEAVLAVDAAALERLRARLIA